MNPLYTTPITLERTTTVRASAFKGSRKVAVRDAIIFTKVDPATLGFEQYPPLAGWIREKGRIERTHGNEDEICSKCLWFVLCIGRDRLQPELGVCRSYCKAQPDV